MEVKYLNYILTIAERHSMTRAARDLFVSQSSLSQYVTRLEQEIGMPLFFRSRGELLLTPAGELYVQAARKIIAIRNDLYNDIASLNECGHIRIGITSNFGLRMISEIIPQLKLLYPKVSIEISEVNLPVLKKMLMDEKLDIGIAAESNLAPFEEQSTILRKEEVFFAISKNHPYTLQNMTGVISYQEIAENFMHDNFLLSKGGTSLRLLMDQIFDSTGFSPSAFCETNSISATRRMIAQDAGVALIAESCSVDRNMIAYYSVSPTLYRFNVLIQRKNWGSSRPEQQLIRYVTDYFKNHTEHPYIAENDISTDSTWYDM